MEIAVLLLNMFVWGFSFIWIDDALRVVNGVINWQDIYPKDLLLRPVPRLCFRIIAGVGFLLSATWLGVIVAEGAR